MSRENALIGILCARTRSTGVLLHATSRRGEGECINGRCYTPAEVASKIEGSELLC
jgi:hypothetical protein